MNDNSNGADHQGNDILPLTAEEGVLIIDNNTDNTDDDERSCASEDSETQQPPAAASTALPTRRIAISELVKNYHDEEETNDNNDNTIPQPQWIRVWESLVTPPENEHELVEEFVLDRRDFVEALSEAQLLQLMTVIGGLPGLCKVTICFVQQLPDQLLLLPTKALVAILSSSGKSKLEYLEVAWVRLQGTDQEWQELLQVLPTHTQLKEVKFRNLCLGPPLANGTTIINRPQPMQMHHLWQVLSGLPCLEEVFVLDAHRILQDWRVPDPTAAHALQRLGGSQSMRTLCLMLPLTNLQVEHLALALSPSLSSSSSSNTPNHGNLERLALFRCQVSDQGCMQLAAMLEHNTRLQILRLDDNQIGNPGCMALAKALRINTSLRILDLKGNHNVSLAGYQALSNMLEYDNYELMGLETDRIPITTTTTIAASSSSSELVVDDDNLVVSRQFQAKIGMFLKLNEQARKIFLRYADHRDLFIECLSACRNELDFLFYYLLANPMLCQA